VGPRKRLTFPTVTTYFFFKDTEGFKLISDEWAWLIHLSLLNFKSFFLILGVCILLRA
jgi:hypothetical protein